MTSPDAPQPTLRDFAPALFALAITSISLGALTEWMLANQQRFHMFMMFGGIVCGVFDLGIAWLVFGGGSYWLRLPMIILLTVGTSYLLSRTFPQTASVALGELLLRVLLIGVPLLLLRFRGLHLTHRSDKPNKHRGSLQFSLASLLTLFTSTAILLVAGRFAEFSWDAFYQLLLFSFTTVVTLVALIAAWSRTNVSMKIMGTILMSLTIGIVPFFAGWGYDVIMMMLGALEVTVITTVLGMRLAGYRIERAI